MTVKVLKIVQRLIASLVLLSRNITRKRFFFLIFYLFFVAIL
jgi:hypothetical protein